jgi:hypothetical protein
MGTPMERSFAQKTRVDRNPLSFESKAQRASFWARQQKMLQQRNEQEMAQNVAEISQGVPHQQTQFGVANIHAATLESALPSNPGQSTIAGLGEGGIVPPPPPH